MISFPYMTVLTKVQMDKKMQRILQWRTQLLFRRVLKLKK